MTFSSADRDPSREDPDLICNSCTDFALHLLRPHPPPCGGRVSAPFVPDHVACEFWCFIVCKAGHRYGDRLADHDLLIRFQFTRALIARKPHRLLEYQAWPRSYRQRIKHTNRTEALPNTTHLIISVPRPPRASIAISLQTLPVNTERNRFLSSAPRRIQTELSLLCPGVATGKEATTLRLPELPLRVVDISQPAPINFRTIVIWIQ